MVLSQQTYIFAGNEFVVSMTSTAITLTFDDALDSQLDLALPLLDRYGLKATFYTHIYSTTLAHRSAEWSHAARHGHELGNHSLLHPAVGSKPWVTTGNALEHYSLDRMRIELETANNVLEILDGQKERTFAFPCGNSILGKAGLIRRLLIAMRLDRTRLMGWLNSVQFDFFSKQQDYTKVVRPLFYAARCGGVSKDTNSTEKYNRYAIPSISGDGQSEHELDAAVDKAIELGGWTVFTFHGIDGGHGQYCEYTAFSKLISRLVLDDRVVVKTFIEAAKDVWN